MKELFTLKKDNSSLKNEQIEQLEINLLFDSINKTNTIFGSQYLYYLITQLNYSLLAEEGREYIDQNKTIKEKLSNFNRQRHSTFINYLLGKDDPFWIIKNLNVKMYSILAALNLVCLLSLLFTSYALVPFILLSFFNSTVYYSRKLSFFYVRDTVLCANDMYILLQKLKKENINTPTFKSFKNTSLLIKYLYAEVNPFLNELSVIFFLVEAFKSIFLVDLFFANILFKRIEKNKLQLLKSYYFIGKVDVHISVNELKKDKKLPICEPVFSKKDVGFIKVTKLVSPLIKDFKPIDFELKGGMVITGHNASGKSSLIKAIITNYIFGKTLGICFCEKLSTSFDTIQFLIGSSDNISNRQSLYQYEIEKLEEIVLNTQQEDKKNLILLDEIIRGTNEEDREKISFSIAKYLGGQKNNSILISTHSISLAKKLIRNGFNSSYFKTSLNKITGLVKFEYELMKGVEETTNAKELLKKYKFPNAIIENIN